MTAPPPTLSQGLDPAPATQGYWFSAMKNHLSSLSTTPTFRSNFLKEIQPNTYYLHNSYIHNYRSKVRQQGIDEL